MTNLEELHIKCQCWNKDHTFVITRYTEDPCDYYFIDRCPSYFYSLCVHLTPHPFFTRIKNAIRYIFGYRNKYGDFDEVMFTEDDVSSIIRFLEKE